MNGHCVLSNDDEADARPSADWSAWLPHLKACAVRVSQHCQHAPLMVHVPLMMDVACLLGFDAKVNVCLLEGLDEIQSYEPVSSFSFPVELSDHSFSFLLWVGRVGDPTKGEEIFFVSKSTGGLRGYRIGTCSTDAKPAPRSAPKKTT